MMIFKKIKISTLFLLPLLFYGSNLRSETQAFLKPDIKASAVSDQQQEHRTLLFADNLSYDKEKEIINASGHVEVSRGELTLFADKIVYDQKEDKIIALGNVLYIGTYYSYL